MIFLHIGTHKTGTKSLQQWLADNRRLLLAEDISFYAGQHKNPNNHSELGLAALREDRDSFARIRFPASAGLQYRQAVARQIKEYLNACLSRHVIFSNEDLSLLRYPEELAILRDLFGGYEVKVVVCLRKKADFLRSYREQILKVPGRLPTSRPDSSLYVESDSWLVDYSSLHKAYSSAFGDSNVAVIDYDAALARDRTVIPSMLAALGVELPADKLEISRYFLNESPLRRHAELPA